jgi:hypothetical protein
MVNTLKNTLPSLCDSCQFGEWRTVTEKRPIFSTSFIMHDVKLLAMFCKDELHYINKKRTKLGECNYKPKAGKIGKKLYQKTLFEN